MIKTKPLLFRLGPSGFLILTLAISSFMARLDTNIISIALPSIADWFDVPAAATSNLMLSFLLVITVLLMPMGYLADRLGFRRILMAGYVAFIAGSLLCGLAGNFFLLIAARGVQGAGAAMLLISAFSMIPKRLAPDAIGRAMGWLSVAGSLGILAGAPLGGILTQWLTWRSIFLINLPLGLAAILLVWQKLDPDEPQIRSGNDAPFDWIGCLLAASGLLLISFGLDRLRQTFFSMESIVLLAGGGLVMVLFFQWQRRSDHPMIDPAIWRNQTFRRGLSMQGLMFAALASHGFSAPFYLDMVLGLSPQVSGLTLAAFPVGVILAAPAAGRKADRNPPIRVCTAAAAGCMLTTAIFVLLVYMGFYRVMPVYLFFLGLCFGSYMGPAAKFLLTGAPELKQGSTTGVFHTTNNLSLMMGVAFAGLVLHLGQEVVDPGHAAGAAFLPVYLFNTACFAGAAIAGYRTGRLSEAGAGL